MLGPFTIFMKDRPARVELKRSRHLTINLNNMYCSHCGKQSPQGAKFCINCGTGFSATSTADPQTHIFETKGKSNHRNRTLFAIAAGVVVIAAASYFLFFNNKKENNPTLATTPTPSEVVVEPATIPGDYPIASTRELKQEEVLNLTTEEMKTMRNEIYARHGYIFQNKEMLAHFSKMPWYKPAHADVREMLTPLEKKNIALIKEMEKYNDDHGYDFGR